MRKHYLLTEGNQQNVVCIAVWWQPTYTVGNRGISLLVSNIMSAKRLVRPRRSFFLGSRKDDDLMFYLWFLRWNSNVGYAPTVISEMMLMFVVWVLLY